MRHPWVTVPNRVQGGAAKMMVSQQSEINPFPSADSLVTVGEFITLSNRRDVPVPAG